MMRSNRCVLLAAGGIVVAVLVSASGVNAAEPPTGRGGGLVPGNALPASGATREELLRSWDLDGDGSISKSEADLARARMRRKRLEMQLGAGIDPLTGLPRGIQAESDTSTSKEVADDEPVFQLPPEPPPSETGRAKPGSPPGMRVPGQPSIAGPQAARSQPARASGSTPAATAPPTLSGRASWLPPQRLAPVVTGGVRAGAPAATAGYGAGAWSDLNAGRRPAPPPTESAVVGGGSTNSSGGLLPSTRQPGRTGAMILPTVPGRPSTAAVPGLPPPPAAGIPMRPRITADEIGADRP